MEGRDVASIAEFQGLATKVRNWDRWGGEDQLGTLNFITPAKVAESARMVRRGAVFPLGVAFEANGIWPGNFFRRNPVHLMTVDGGDSARLAAELGGWDRAGPVDRMLTEYYGSITRFADDMIIMPLQAATQWDALSHVWYDDQLYNGYPASAVTSLGATRNSIDRVDAKGIVSRAVLLDVARHRGRDHVEPNDAIGPAELDAVCARQDVEVRPGDIVLVRTGWWPQFAQMGDGTAWRAGCPGLSWTAAEWLHEREAAAVAADNVAVEAGRCDVDGVQLPMHLLCLRDMGMMLGEIWDFEDLAADCAEDGVYEMQLIAPPLRITGAVGSPINPIALK
jgi:kynurenine formamidase